MTTNDRVNLIVDYKYLVIEIMHEYDNGKVDIGKILDIGTNGLVLAATSIKSIKELENIDFKSYASFYIKSEINKYIQEQIKR